MSQITQEQNDALQSALSGLVTRLLSQAGLTEQEVNQLIVSYVEGVVATDEEAATGTGSGLVSTSQAMLVAQKAIDDWVGATPGALDTLTELADALQNNPDVISEILAQLATKASVDYVNSLMANVGVVQNADFNSADYDGLFAINGKTVNDITPSKHQGFATAARLNFNGADEVEGVTEAIADGTTLMVEADVAVGGAKLTATATSETGTGQITFDLDHNNGPTLVIVGGSVVYDPLSPTPAQAPDLTTPGKVTLAEEVPAGQAVTLVAYTPKATEGTFNRVTLRAYHDGRTYMANLNGDGQTAQQPPVWSSAEVMVEDLAKILTDAFNAEAQA